MDGVVQGLLNYMIKPRVVIRGGLTFYLGSFADRKVVLARSGVGKVNVALCTALMVNQFGAKSVIFSGTAGALRRRLRHGDIVMSLDLIQHDLDATALGRPPGVIPGLEIRAIPADSALIGLAQLSAQAILGLTLHRGRILTGDQFIGPNKRTYLRTLFNGTCVEMEGGAVAQVCTLSHTPFLVLCCIAERADGKFLKGYEYFRRAAANHFVLLIKEMFNHSTPAPGLDGQTFPPLAEPVPTVPPAQPEVEE